MGPLYFGGKLISKGTYTTFGGSGNYITLTPVAADRLGSIGKFYPYGVGGYGDITVGDIPSQTPNTTMGHNGESPGQLLLKSKDEVMTIPNCGTTSNDKQH